MTTRSCLLRVVSATALASVLLSAAELVTPDGSETIVAGWSRLHAEAQRAYDKGDLSAACTLAARALDLTKAEHAPELATAAVLNTLGAAELNLKEIDAAGRALERALTIRRRLLPNPHIDLAISANNYAGLLLLRGDLGPAAATAGEAVQLFEALGQANTPEYGAALSNLATALSEQGEYARAIPIFARAHSVQAATEPRAVPLFLRMLVNEGIAVQHSGDLTTASRVFEQAVALARESGPSSAASLTGALNGLGALRVQQGRPSEARQILNEAFVLSARATPPDPVLAGIIEANLARACQRSGDPAAAEEHFLSALAALRPVREGAPVAYASSLNNYGLLLAAKRRYGQAAEVFQEALAVFEQRLGAAHPSTVATTVNLADLAEHRHQFGRAAALYQRAVELDSSHFGAHHYRVGQDLNSLGTFRVRQKHYAEGIQLLRQAHEILREAWGPDHPDVALVAANLGRALAMTKQLDEATSYFGDAIRIRQQQLGADNVQLIALYEEYAVILRNNHRFAESENAKLQAIRIRVRQALGHASTTSAS